MKRGNKHRPAKSRKAPKARRHHAPKAKGSFGMVIIGWNDAPQRPVDIRPMKDK